MARRLHLGILICATAALIAGCGGGDDSTSPDTTGGLPVLAGTPIPTITVLAAPTPPCDPPPAGDIPANFPADVPVPPDTYLTAIVTAPYLGVTLLVTPPAVRDPRALPQGVVAAAMLDQLSVRGWSVTLNPDVAEGFDYSFTAPDGRIGHFNAQTVPDCSGKVQLIIDMLWITG